MGPLSTERYVPYSCQSPISSRTWFPRPPQQCNLHELKPPLRQASSRCGGSTPVATARRLDSGWRLSVGLERSRRTVALPRCPTPTRSWCRSWISSVGWSRAPSRCPVRPMASPMRSAISPVLDLERSNSPILPVVLPALLPGAGSNTGRRSRPGGTPPRGGSPTSGTPSADPPLNPRSCRDPYP